MHTPYHLTMGVIFLSAIIRISPAMPLTKRCTWPLSINQHSDTDIWLGNIHSSLTIDGCVHEKCTGSFQDQENSETSIKTFPKKPSHVSSSSSALSTTVKESVINPESQNITRTRRWSWKNLVGGGKSSLIDTSLVVNIDQNDDIFTNNTNDETTNKTEVNKNIKNNTLSISGHGQSSRWHQEKFEKILNNNTKKGRENGKDNTQFLQNLFNDTRNPQIPGPEEGKKERSGRPYRKEKRKLDEQKRSTVVGDTSQLLGWSTRTSSNSVPEERKHTNWLTGEAKYENKPGGTWIYCHDGHQNCVNQPPKGHQWDEHHWYYCHDAAENCEPQPHGPHTAREPDPALATHVPLIIKRSNEIEQVTFPNKRINEETFLGGYETSKGVLEFDEAEKIGSPETVVRRQGDLAERFAFPTQENENHTDRLFGESDSWDNIVPHARPEGRLKCDSKGCRSSEMDRLELHRSTHAQSKASPEVREFQSRRSRNSISSDMEPKSRRVAVALVRGIIRNHDKQFQSGECELTELHKPNPKNEHICKRKTISPEMEKLLAKQKTQEASDAKRKAAETQWINELQHSSPVKQVGMSLLAPLKALEFGDPTNPFTGKSKAEEYKGNIEKLKQKEARNGAKGKRNLKAKMQKQKRERLIPEDEIKNYELKKDEMKTLEEELAQLKHLLTATREKIREIVEIHIWPAMDGQDPRKHSKRNLSVSNSTISWEHDVERQPKSKLINLKYYLTTVDKKFKYIIENYKWPSSDEQESSKHKRRDCSSLDVTAERKDGNHLQQGVKEKFNDLNQILQTLNEELKDFVKSYEWPASDAKDRTRFSRRKLLGTNATADWKQNSKNQFHNKLSELKTYIQAASDHLKELVDSSEHKEEEDEQSQDSTRSMPIATKQTPTSSDNENSKDDYKMSPKTDPKDKGPDIDDQKPGGNDKNHVASSKEELKLVRPFGSWNLFTYEAWNGARDPSDPKAKHSEAELQHQHEKEKRGVEFINFQSFLNTNGAGSGHFSKLREEIEKIKQEEDASRE